MVLAYGIRVFLGDVIARTVGVFVALGSIVTMFMWLPYDAISAITVIAMDIAIVWTLTVHGRDLAEG